MTDTVKINTSGKCSLPGCGQSGAHEHERGMHERGVDRAGDHNSRSGPAQPGALRRLLGKD
jgi:hypothetical protein